MGAQIMSDNCNVSGVGQNLNASRTLASPTQHLERPHSPGTLNSTQTVNQMGKPASAGSTYQLAQTPRPDVRNISLA